MIRVKAVGFPQFLAAHAVFRTAGVDVTASGGNEMRVPDDTDLDVLRAVAATGAVVHADLAEVDATAAEPAADVQNNPTPDPPPGEDTSGTADARAGTRKPRKSTTRRTSKE